MIFFFNFRAVFKFEGNNLNVSATGKDFQDFKSAFTNDDRGFGYIRIGVSTSSDIFGTSYCYNIVYHII